MVESRGGEAVAPVGREQCEGLDVERRCPAGGGGGLDARDQAADERRGAGGWRGTRRPEDGAGERGMRGRGEDGTVEGVGIGDAEEESIDAFQRRDVRGLDGSDGGLRWESRFGGGTDGDGDGVCGWASLEG